MKRFRVHADGRVTDAAGVLLGRVVAGPDAKGWLRYYALDAEGGMLAGPTRLRDLAALVAIRSAGHEATLTDLMVTI